MNKILTKKIKHTISFRVFCFLKHNKFSWGGVLLFLELGLKSTELRFWKYNKCFLLIKYKNFLISDLESSISGNIKICFGGFFLVFMGLGWKVRHIALIYTTWRSLFSFWMPHETRHFNDGCLFVQSALCQNYFWQKVSILLTKLDWLLIKLFHCITNRSYWACRFFKKLFR